MRHLLISNTHYQTIVAVQLAQTLFKEDEVVLLISDHSKGAENVVKQLKILKCFTEVDFVENRNLIYNFSRRDMFQDFLDFTFKKKNRYSYYFKNIKNLYFDDIIIYNFENDIFGLYIQLSSYNKNIKVSLFEEGLFSYENSIRINRLNRYTNNWRKLFSKKTIDTAFENFYCYFPKLYKQNLTPVGIPLICQSSPSVEILKRAFGVQLQNLKYNEKYIIFTSVYDFEGSPIGEYDLICRIADLVGKENILVKEHPRDTRGLYKKSGFKVDSNSHIPWEIIQLSMNFSDKVFITATSGSVLAGSLMTENKPNIFYMFNCCHISDNIAAVHTVSEISRILNDVNVKELFSNVHIAKSIELINYNE